MSSESNLDHVLNTDMKKTMTSEKDVEERAAGEVEGVYVVDRAMEKKMLMKFDLHILPMLSIMYLFKYVPSLPSPKESPLMFT